MRYETQLKRRREAEAFTKALVEKAKNRSQELYDGQLNYAFVAGYLESALAQVAAESPASVKVLKGMV
jgi:hypothetical protein